MVSNKEPQQRQDPWPLSNRVQSRTKKGALSDEPLGDESAGFVEQLFRIGQDVGVAEPGRRHGPHLAPGEPALLPPRHRRRPRRLPDRGDGGSGRGRRLLGLERAPGKVPDVLPVPRAHLLGHGPVQPAVHAREPCRAAAAPAEHLLPRERLRRGLHLWRRRVAEDNARVWGLSLERLHGRRRGRRRRRRGVGVPRGGHGARRFVRAGARFGGGGFRGRVGAEEGNRRIVVAFGGRVTEDEDANASHEGGGATFDGILGPICQSDKGFVLE